MSHRSKLKERQRIILEAAVAKGSELFDPKAGLCHEEMFPDEPHRAERYRGHFVAWRSPSYAEALLALGRDLERAAFLVEKLCDYLYEDGGDPEYGNFFAVAEWERIQDVNAVAFLAVELGQIRLLYGDRLPGSTCRRLERTLEIASVGLVRRKAVFFYTNIFLLCLAGKLLLGELLNRPDLLRLAEVEWDSFLNHLGRENISEYNSATYTPIQIHCIQIVREKATNPKMRREAEETLDFFLKDFALHYHRPSRAHAGCTARAYRQGLLTLVRSSNIMAYALLGEPLPEVWDQKLRANALFSGVHWTRYDWIPPKSVRDFFSNKPLPIQIRERVVSYWGRDYEPRVIEWTHDQTERYSLSTQYGVWANYGHYVPFLLVHAGTGQRRSFFFQNEPQYPLIDTWFGQNESAALGAFFWKVNDFTEFMFWWKGAPPWNARQICHLGNPEEMTALLLDGKPWNGRKVPGPGSVIEVRKPEIEMRLHLLQPPEGVRTPKIETRKVNGDIALFLTYASSKSADRFVKMPPAILPVYFEVREGGTKGPWKTPRIAGPVREGLWKMKAGTLEVDVPLTLEARNRLSEVSRPPIRGPLVESAVYTIMPGSPVERKKIVLDRK